MEAKLISRRSSLELGAALAGVLAFGGYAAWKCAPDETKTFPGIRWFPSLGVHTGAQPWEPDPSFVQDFYDRFAAPRENEWFLTIPRYWFVAEKKFNWREFLVDESRAPVHHQQAKDADWKNYKWNTSDVLTEMLKVPVVTENKAKLGIFAAVTATADPDPVPPCMTRKGLTWTDSSGRVHVRFDLEDSWRYTADFLVALVRRYGKTPRISNLGIGEYYPAAMWSHALLTSTSTPSAPTPRRYGPTLRLMRLKMRTGTA